MMSTTRHARDDALGSPHGDPALTHLDALVTATTKLRSQLPTIRQMGRHAASILLSGGRLLAVGNGGSAAQAQHLTAELVGRFRSERRALSALCLNAETSSLTAIANDYGVEEMFARQVAAHGRPGDVLVGLSTSGRSPNVVTALDRARDLGLDVWGLTGPGPTPVGTRCDLTVEVVAETTATVQELHLVVVHLLCATIDAAIAGTVASDHLTAAAR